MRKSVFTGNSATFAGGGLWISSSVARVDVYDCRFERNSAPYGGVASIIVVRSITFTKNSWISNRAGRGGDIAMAMISSGVHPSELVLVSTSSVGATARGGGGGSLYVNGTNCEVRISKSAFKNCVSALPLGRGGCVLFESGVLAVHSVAFVNASSTEGGAVAVHAALNAGYPGLYLPTAVTLTNCNFADNSAAGWDGGAVSVTDAEQVTIAGCRFTDNRAMHATEGRGGAVALWDIRNVTVQDCQFIRNLAGARGGGLCVYHVVEPKGSVRRSAVRVSGNAFYNNTAMTNGGGLFLNFQNLGDLADVRNCSFAGNYAPLAPGFMWSIINKNQTDPTLSCRFEDKKRDVVSVPRSLRLRRENEIRSNTSLVVTTGERLPRIYVAFVDYYGHEPFVAGLSSILGEVSMLGRDGVAAVGSTATIENDRAVFDSLTLFGRPGSAGHYELSWTSGTVPDYRVTSDITVTFRTCADGTHTEHVQDRFACKVFHVSWAPTCLSMTACRHVLWVNLVTISPACTCVSRVQTC